LPPWDPLLPGVFLRAVRVSKPPGWMPAGRQTAGMNLRRSLLRLSGGRVASNVRAPFRRGRRITPKRRPLLLSWVWRISITTRH
jgi:hypothetical protein